MMPEGIIQNLKMDLPIRNDLRKLISAKSLNQTKSAKINPRENFPKKNPCNREN